MLALTGCGRVGFGEGSGDAVAKICPNPVGHDEDHDGIDDACDGCPHIADGAQVDTDGDGVDDVCDPNPASPRETIAFFDPFLVQRPEWFFAGAPATFAGDSFTVDARNGGFGAILQEVPIADTYTLGGRIEAVTNGQRQMTIAVGDSASAHYYCELEGTMLYGKLAETHTTDGSVYSVDTLTMTRTPIQDTDIDLTMFHATPNIGCATAFPADVQRIDTAIPIAITADHVAFTAFGAVVRFDYFIHIRTN